MFVKSNKNVKENGEEYYTHHIVESYRNENGDPRHRYLANLSDLPEQVVEQIRLLLQGKLTPEEAEPEFIQKDALRGAGQMAIWRAWRKVGLNKVLSDLSKAQRQSVFAMVASRITDPCSKLALKEECADTMWARKLSDNRLDEDTLYEVMDELDARFQTVQKKLASGRQKDPVLFLYDTTSSFFEGTEAEGGKHGHSKDHRWDRHQIVIGMVCGEQGAPLAVKVWPGNTADVASVQQQIDELREQFGIQKGIFVGDGGMYSEANLEHIKKQGMDYIVGLQWHKKKQLLQELGTGQQELFVEEGVYQWEENRRRYVGCHSERRRHREKGQRQKAMQVAQQQLSHLKQTSWAGRYYTEARLRAKISDMLKSKGVADLWSVDIEPLEEASGDQKVLLDLSFSRNQMEIKKRTALEGRYVVATSVPEKQMDGEEVIESYKRLQKVERGFRHIKSFLRIRPIYHRLWPRIRAHVLICFLAYYLTWWMEQELRRKGLTTEVETLLKRWDQLQLSHITIVSEEETVDSHNWTLGERGSEIKGQIKEIGIWDSLSAYKRSAWEKW